MVSSAAVHADSGRAAIAACSRSVTDQPMLNSVCTTLSRSDRICVKNAFDEPAPSVRTRIGWPCRTGSGSWVTA